MKTRFDLDPTPTKAAAIAILLFIDTFLSSIGASVLLGVMPSTVQILASVVAAGSATATYLLGFLGYGKEDGET